MHFSAYHVLHILVDYDRVICTGGAGAAIMEEQQRQRYEHSPHFFFPPEVLRERTVGRCF